jgi:PAS domain S-box-containing protein
MGKATPDRGRDLIVDMIERVTDAFFALDREWRFSYVNAEAERVLFRSREELLGHHVWERFPEAVGSTFHEEYERAVATGETAQFVEFYPPLDAWLEVRAFPSEDGLSVYFRDVTGQRMVEQRLEESRRQLETIALNASLALFMMDERQHCTYMNPAAEELTGYTAEEVRDRPLHDYVHYLHPDGSPFPIEDCPIDRALPQRMRETGEEVFVHKDGHFYPVAFTASPILVDGRAIGTIIEAREISAEQRAREEIIARDREAALIAAVGRALTAGGELRETLQLCAEAMVKHLDAAFARVWTLNEAEQMLELQASAGQYTHLDGPHGRVPVGAFKIGRIAAEREPHLTNDVLTDPRVSDKEWAAREGMVAFAGYPLMIRDRVVGVLAMFARHPLSERSLRALTAVGDGIASAIVRSGAELARERLVRELEGERRRLHEVFMQAPAAISVTEGPSHITVVQNSVSRTLGGRDALGRPIREVFPELEGQGFLELLDRVYSTGQPYTGIEMLVHWDRDGDGALEQAYFDVSYQPLRDPAGTVYGILTLGIDVTEKVRGRQELERRNDELARLAAALERSNGELDQFAYVASHDLKAPLRGIANLAQWVQEDVGESLSEESMQHMQLLQGRVQRMEALIDGILAYSRAGRVREKVGTIDTGRLIAETIELLAPPEGAEIVVPQDLPHLAGERTALQQVFLNLIGNALKYAGAARADVRVTVSCRESPSGYTFSVADNGPGIAAEYHDRIWGIFQTLHARDKVEGTGVGLSVVKKIVESRGGRVGVGDAAGGGATFTFSWPPTTPEDWPRVREDDDTTTDTGRHQQPGGR